MQPSHDLPKAVPIPPDEPIWATRGLFGKGKAISSGRSDEHLYCDGGVISKNPSVYGGTYAWVLVWWDVFVSKGSGIILPADVKTKRQKRTVTNNQSELLAAYHALTAAGPAFAGTLFTDSMVTMHRLTEGSGFAGIPQWLRLAVLELRRNRKWQVALVKGHPTKKELAAGKHTNGSPVSKWNVVCDRRCQQLARRFLKNLENP